MRREQKQGLQINSDYVKGAIFFRAQTCHYSPKKAGKSEKTTEKDLNSISIVRSFQKGISVCLWMIAQPECNSNPNVKLKSNVSQNPLVVVVEGEGVNYN